LKGFFITESLPSTAAVQTKALGSNRNDTFQIRQIFSIKSNDTKQAFVVTFYDLSCHNWDIFEKAENHSKRMCDAMIESEVKK